MVRGNATQTTARASQWAPGEVPKAQSPASPAGAQHPHAQARVGNGASAAASAGNGHSSPPNPATRANPMRARSDPRHDYLVSNFHVAFPAGRWGHGRFRRSKWQRFVVDPLRGIFARSGGTSSADIRALVEAQMAQTQAIREGHELLGEKVDGLCRAVQGMEKGIERLASTGITASMPMGGGMMPRMAGPGRELSEEHNAVLKEIFDTNVELRQAIAQNKQSPGRAQGNGESGGDDGAKVAEASGVS